MSVLPTKIRALILALNFALTALFPLAAPAQSGRAQASPYNPEKEIREATDAIARNQKDALAYERRAAAYNRLEKYDLALKDLNESIKLKSNSPVAYFHRGLAYAKLKRFPAALADLNKCIAMRPTLAAAYALRASVYIGMEKYQLALKDAKEALRLDPKDPNNHLVYSRAAHYTGQHGASVSSCSRAIQMNPKDPTAWDNRGVAYLNLRQFQSAVNDISKAIALKPSEPKYWCHRGIVFCEMGNYDRAIADLTKAIELKPDYSLALFDRGVSYYRMGKYELAYKDIQMAIHYDPNYALAWQQFPLDPTKVPKNKEPMDEAKDWYYRATSRLMLMHGNREASEIGLAVSDLKKYLDLAGWQSELSGSAVLIIYVCQLRLGRAAEARATLDEASAKCNRNAWPYPLVSFLRGDTSEEGLFAQASTHETQTEARSLVALHHWHSGRRDIARPHMDWVSKEGHGSVVGYSLVIRELEKLNPQRTLETERFYDRPRAAGQN